MPVKGRVGKCRQVGTVEIDVEMVLKDPAGRNKSSYPYHDVEVQIMRAFHRYVKDHLADAVVTRTNPEHLPVAAVILSGDKEIAQLTIYPEES